MKELQEMASKNAMTFEDFLTLRKRLGNVARTAQDGNVRTAASIMIDELEKLPLSKEAADLKPLADEARQAARQRFELLDKDPAYKAAINETTPADKFFDKFVINGVHKNINTMVENLKGDPLAQQYMKAGTMQWLKDKSGITERGGNFSSKSFNDALKKLDDVQNLDAIFTPENATQLRTLGNVAHYVNFQPKGSFVNNSGTLVGALAEKAKGAAQTYADIVGLKTTGIPVGTVAAKVKEELAGRKAVKEMTEPAAGVRTKLKDVGKK
jgi:hypothetical protein